MVVGAFPAAKLGALLLKQISKPIANAVKQQAKSSPVFRTYVCMPPAQFYNWCEVKAKMWILNLGKPVNIPVLNEAMAIELGANLLGEGIIFIIAAGILIAEYNRSARKEAAKEQAKKEEMEEFNRTIRELFFQAEQHATQIREIMRVISDLESRVVQKPWVPKKDKLSEITESEIGLLTPKTKEELKQEDEDDDDGVGAAVFTVEDTREGILLKSIRSLEQELLQRDEKPRQPGILNIALDYLYNDVYRVP